MTEEEKVEVDQIEMEEVDSETIEDRIANLEKSIAHVLDMMTKMMEGEVEEEIIEEVEADETAQLRERINALEEERDRAVWTQTSPDALKWTPELAELLFSAWRGDKEKVSATLGEDSLNAGLIAGIGGLALVAVAMVLYYRALGLINVIGLTVFGSIVITAYSLLGEFRGVTLTLAGVAGVIVHGRAGVGIVAIAGKFVGEWHEQILDRVAAGEAPQAIVDSMTEDEKRSRTRQFAILTADGKAAAM